MSCQRECMQKDAAATDLNQGIWWVASYPKSGNTWFRAFLTSLLSGADAPVSINALVVPWGISRAQVDKVCGMDTSLLAPDEILPLWPDITRRYMKITSAPRVLKTHAACTAAPENGFLCTPATTGAVYLVRNPLDVCVSFSHHLDVGIDDTITLMCDEHHRRSDSSQDWRAGLTEVVSSWRANVESWMQVTAFPVLILRYEDLLENPLCAFRQAVDFMGCGVDDARLESAIGNSSFAQMRGQELRTGFREKSPRTRQFFRQGCKGEGKRLLTAVQVSRLVEANQCLMERLGYLDDL